MSNQENNSNNKSSNVRQMEALCEVKANATRTIKSIPKQKLLFLVIAVIIVIIIVCVVVKIVSPSKEPPPADVNERLAEAHITVDTKEVMHVIENASDLVVMKDKYIVNQSYEKSAAIGDWELPFGAKEVFISFTSDFGIGIDVSKVQVNVNDDKQTITITLPKPKLIYDKIDMENAYVKTTKDSLLVKSEDKELLDVMASFQKEKEAEIMADDELMEKATKNAETVLNDLLVKSGTTQNYRIIFE